MPKTKMKKLIVANWKMNKNTDEAISFVHELKTLVKEEQNVEIAVCPPFTALNAVAKEIKNSNIKLGAQNMYSEDYGAYTGEVSPLMLKDIGCRYVILGHSERREIFGEDDFLINRKIVSALNHSIGPILCIGEDLEQRKNNKTKEVIEAQLKNCLRNITKYQISKINIAYEPIWAISKGNPNHRAATKEDAEESHNFIRGVIARLYDERTSKNIRIIYGGSMKPDNAKELLAMPNIDGGLVGNASLNVKSFVEIIEYAE